MLSRREIKQRYDKHRETFQIRTTNKRFSRAYIEKAFHNLEVAGILQLLNDPVKKESLDIYSDESYHDWVIITSYYSMYMAATAALAKLGLKAVSHGATIIALEYRFCIEKSLLHRRYIKMIEDASFKREDVAKLDEAMMSRVAVQYTVTEKFGRKESKRIYSDAIEFVNKISDIINMPA